MYTAHALSCTVAATAAYTAAAAHDDYENLNAQHTHIDVLLVVAAAAGSKAFSSCYSLLTQGSCAPSCLPAYPLCRLSFSRRYLISII
jgi:hypothetical protein